MNGQYPGEVVDQVAGGAAGAVKGVVSSVAGGIQGAGAQIQSAVDKPFQALGVPESPLRIVDKPISGVVSAGQNFVNRGVIESVETVGRGITDGLDEVPKTLTGLGRGGGPRGLPFELPEPPWGRR